MKNFNRNKVLLTLGLGCVVSTSAFADEQGNNLSLTRKFSITLGFYLPSSVPGLSSSTGSFSALSYRLSADAKSELLLESAAASYSISDGFDSARIDTSALSLVSIQNSKDSNSYYGFSLGMAKPSASSGGSSITGDTKLVLGIRYGVNISKTTFAQARYQYETSNTAKALTGLALEFGYRF